MRHCRPTLRTLTGVTLATLGVAAPIWAQSYETGGIQLRFDLDLGINAASNRTLATNDEKGSVEARTTLGFGLLTETRTQRLAFNASGSLRDISGNDDDGLNEGFSNPMLALSYGRTSAAAEFGFDASLRETDLADNALIFDEETGEFILLDGTATRRITSGGLRYTWGNNTPVGYGLSAGYEQNDFRNGVATDVSGTPISDNTRLTLGANLRVDLDEARRLGVGLSYSQFDTDAIDTDTRETLALDTTLTYDRPLGPLSFTFGITDTEDGTRYALTTARSFAYPLGTVSGRLGVVRGVTGDTVLTAGLAATRDLPRGGLNVAFARDVTSGSQQDTEQTNTSLQLGYRHDLSRLASINVNFNVGDTNLTASDQGTTSATLTAAYNRTLTKDWNMNFGVRHRYRDSDVSGTARSNEVFMNLNRAFITRF